MSCANKNQTVFEDYAGRQTYLCDIGLPLIQSVITSLSRNVFNFTPDNELGAYESLDSNSSANITIVTNLQSLKTYQNGRCHHEFR